MQIFRRTEIHAVFFNDGTRFPQNIIAFQNLAAKFGTHGIDLSCEHHFLLSGKQRNISHLLQVHTDRVIAPSILIIHRDGHSLIRTVQIIRGSVVTIMIQRTGVKIVLTHLIVGIKMVIQVFWFLQGRTPFRVEMVKWFPKKPFGIAAARFLKSDKT